MKRNKILDMSVDIVVYHALHYANVIDYRRYNARGVDGLSDISKKPHNSPNKKLNNKLIARIITLRNERNIGVRRIHLELFVQDEIHLSLATIHKALKIASAKPIKKLKRDKKFKRYQSPIPGDRVQIDTCKIASGMYQYTSVDDCSRWRVMELYKRRTAANTLDFRENVEVNCVKR